MSARRESPFLVALLVGAVVRVLVQVAFTPGFVFSDGVTYLQLADDLGPSPERPVGYAVVLRLVSFVSRDVTAITVVQHLLGLLTAVVLYGLLRRWGVRPLVATLACLPVLLDEMQLVLEHSVLSDTVFELIVLLAVLVLAWERRPRLEVTALGGALIGVAALVRTVGEPLLLVGVVFCWFLAATWRRRLLHVVVLVVGALVPLGAYAAWYHHDHGRYAVSQASGLALYMRTTSFVDCAHLDVPAYERTLCPATPVDERRDPTYYGFHDHDTVPRLVPPPGVTENAALRDFARRAVEQQPGGYLRVVLRDAGYGFWPHRDDEFGYETAAKWGFAAYVDLTPTPYTGPAYADHGGAQLASHQPLADAFATYGRWVYLPGPLVAVLALLALAGLVVPRPNGGSPGAPPVRPLLLMLLLIGVGLPLVPDVTAQFVWRYQLPAIAFVPPAAALAWTRLRWRAPSADEKSEDQGTTATPSTD